MTDLRFPQHNCGLYLTHNEYRDCYQKITDFHSDDGDCWVSEEQKAKAIETDNVWSLQWYPITPIGFYRLLACDLDVLLEKALELEGK